MSWYTCLCGIIRVVAQIGKSFFSPPPPPPLLSLVPGEIGLTCGGSECACARSIFILWEIESRRHICMEPQHTYLFKAWMCVYVSTLVLPPFFHGCEDWLVGSLVGPEAWGGLFRHQRLRERKGGGEKKTKGEKRLLLPSTDDDFSIFPSSSLAAIVFRWKMH